MTSRSAWLTLSPAADEPWLWSLLATTPLFALPIGRWLEAERITVRHAMTFLVGLVGVAALFALHPLQVDTVAWAAERKELLAHLFGVLALGAWLRHVRAPSPPETSASGCNRRAAPSLWRWRATLTP